MSIAELFETLDYGPAPESTTDAQQWLDAHERRFHHFIGGSWHAPADGAYFVSSNPATTRELADIAQGSAADVDAAVQAAARAYPAWSALSDHTRARWLYALARGVQKHARMFSVLESLDNGKPIRESRDIDIPLVARHFYHHAGWAQLRTSEFAGFEPLGVVGQIIPWNFPLLMLAWKIAPALAAGNTVVLKPAEFTSLTALRFAELCQEIGLPAGVVNVVTGDGATGAALVEHPGVAKIAFTGSTEVGRAIRIATAGSGKKLSLELGGKSPFLVFDDADLDSVVEGVVDAIWFNQGQVCCAGSRILVQESVAEVLAEKLRARMNTLRIGDPLDKGVDIGAIVAPVQLERIEALVQQGIDEGASMWQPEWTRPADGCFYPPTLFTNVSPASIVAQVEIFGPVVALMTFRTPAEAVALANNTRYGLAASIWTENINLALDIAPKVKAGTVWINSTNVFDAASGFGGYRESGFGREGGREGMYEYLERPQSTRAPAVRGQAPQHAARSEQTPHTNGNPFDGIDRTAKLYIGGKQTRPDQGYSDVVTGRDGTPVGTVARANRKDVRNAVEAAHKANGWARATAHNRAQVLYYIAENLAIRGGEFTERLANLDVPDPSQEVELAIERLFAFAAWADKWDGAVHHTPYRTVTLAMPEPVGVVGIVCTDTAPLLGLVGAFAPAIALGNTTVVIPSQTAPLIATDLYQVFDTSDLPAGVVNILTGPRRELAEVLAAHDDVDGLWYFAADEAHAAIERLAAGNMKRLWIPHGSEPDWAAQDPDEQTFLRRASEIKNIWIPYGE